MILFLLAGALWLRAQPPRQYTFSHYSTATGMLSNQVNTVVQDETGYIWAGTTDGLVRFDGARYKNFQHRPGDSTTIPANAISQLVIDKRKNLWVLVNNGRVGIFSTSEFKFHEVKIRVKNPAVLPVSIKKLLKDDAGNIFLLVHGHEILTWNEKTNELAEDNNFFASKDGWGFTAFAQEPGTRKYWMALQSGGLAIYNMETGQLSYKGNNIENESAIDRYSDIAFSSNFLFDSRGRLWFSGWGPGFPYVYCYDVRRQQPVFEKYEFISLFKSYNEVNGFFEQQDGDIWIRGLKIFGRYLEAEKKFELVVPGYQNERSIDYRQITALCEDKENNIWVGTGNNGLFRFNPSQEYFTNIRHTSRSTGAPGDGNPLCYLQENDGSLLVGTWGDGLYRYDKNFNNIPLGITGINDKNFVSVWDIFPSQDSNTVWFSCQPGLYKYNRQKRSALFINPPSLTNRTIRQIAEDSKGNLWLGMQTIGLYKWDAAKGKKNFDAGLSRFEAVANGSINHITIDTKGYVWVATSIDGLYVINPENDSVLMHFHSGAQKELRLMDEGVTAVLEYSDSLMVITSATRVLLYNRISRRTRILGNAETMSGFIASLQKDSSGNLWISTTAALYRANIKTRVFVRFNRDDGITNDFFVLSSSYKLPDGRLLFGSSGQFIVFNPAKVAISTTRPNISITEFRVMNRSLPVDSLMQLRQVELGYQENALSVDFSTLAYQSVHMIQYRLEPLDKDWVTADKNNQAIYSYLPPGRYILKFKTINSEGHSEISALTLAVRIDPPFWRSWWFYSLLVLLAGGLLFWLDKARMQRKETMQKMRSNIAGNLHEEINTALSNINILSEMARLKAEAEPQKSKEFIEQIHSRSHNMIIAMDDMLWSISPDNDSMEKTVARMQEFIDAQNNRLGINISMLVESKVKLLKLDMQLRHELFILFKESLRVLVNTAAVDCRIHVAMDRSHLLYSIYFNNSACDRPQLSAMLEKLQTNKYAMPLQARVELQNHGNNCTLLVKIPVV